MPSITGWIVLLGFRLLKAFNKILISHIEDQETLETIMDFVSKSIRKHRIEMARVKYGDFIPSHVYNAVYTDDMSIINALFDNLIHQEENDK